MCACVVRVFLGATNKHAQSTCRIDKITYQPVVVGRSYLYLKCKHHPCTQRQTYALTLHTIMPIMISNIYLLLLLLCIGHCKTCMSVIIYYIVEHCWLISGCW